MDSLRRDLRPGMKADVWLVQLVLFRSPFPALSKMFQLIISVLANGRHRINECEIYAICSATCDTTFLVVCRG
jgi:hypothetical protein